MTVGIEGCVNYVRDEKGKWLFQGKEVREETASRLNKLRIPPAWRNVVVAKDISVKVQAIGQDAAGRWQYRYSKAHIVRAEQRKFNRVKSFSEDMSGIRKQIKKGIADNDSRAYLLELENKTAIRAGSVTDFSAKKKAYGLTTLQYEHVMVEGNKIILDFIAKKGIAVHYELTDDILASWLQKRKAATSVGEKLFPDISSEKLNFYLKKIAGKKYTIKDFRTYHGTRMAYEELKQYAGKELTKRRKREIVKAVSEKVSTFLRNTPAMAKASYIDPMVWDFIGGIQ